MNRYIEDFKQFGAGSFTVKHALTSLYLESYIVGQGVLRWASNDSVPPQDICEFAEYLGFQIDIDLCAKARASEIEITLEQYRRNYQGPTDEQRFEARAAHGPGVELIDVITGHKWTT